MTQHQPTDRLGPIDFQIIEFPTGVVSGAGFRSLLELVDAHRIQVLDLEFVVKDDDGALSIVAAHDVATDPADPIDLADFDGAASGIVGALDLNEVADEIAVGAVAAVLVYEELTLLPTLAAFEASGATIVAGGQILTDDLLDALDAADAADAS